MATITTSRKIAHQPSQEELHPREVKIPRSTTTSTISTVPSKLPLRIPTATTETSTSLVNGQGHSTVYHVYHEGRHKRITTVANPYKDNTLNSRDARRKHREERRAEKVAELKAKLELPYLLPDRREKIQRRIDRLSAKIDSDTDWDRVLAAKKKDEFGFYCHHPFLNFACPPRTLRRDCDKHGPTTCLIHANFLWRKWTLQFGNALSEPGVIDPRGVVSWENDRGKDKSDYGLKGYKNRKWRMWGETGKEWHHYVNSQQKGQRKHLKESIEQTPTLSLVEEQPSKEGGAEGAIELRSLSALGKGRAEAAKADFVLHLNWTHPHPFTKHVRRYHFRYADINFYWKGTGTVKESHLCGFFLHFNHLKLIARVLWNESETPITPAKPSRSWSSISKLSRKTTSKPKMREIVLARYTSSIAPDKSGALEIFDEEVVRFVEQYMPQELERLSISPSTQQPAKELAVERPTKLEIEAGFCDQEEDILTLIRRTRLYEVFVATAMCMIIGEWQKRETIKKIIEIAASEGSGAGGN